ncbi:hypothetical protein [Shewanella algae]|uniref:hypothetical protein n=1 Tax=Shewanella algae TaxID=38313 RepID=UPI001BF01F86|nr:hypothetical protein [Shewanella algae]BCV39510.1 hypothetical protein TUM17378_07720 [Shewanella algae]
MRSLPLPIYTLILLIFLYPWFLKGFYLGNVGELNKSVSLLALAMAFGTPIYAMYLSIRLRQTPAADDTERSHRHFVLLGVIVPSLFTLIGVILYMLGMGMMTELFVYYTFWAIAAFIFLKSDTRDLSAVKTVPASLRVAHGISSLILVVFIAAHLTNHLAANWGGTTHIQVMETLRLYYREPLVEVLLIGTFLFQIVSGLILLSKHADKASDGYRTIQLATGLLVMVFFTSHITAVIGLGRSFASVDTNWDWLVYAPGLLKDPWNVRLVVHYGLGVFALLVHLLLGLRVVMTAHKGEKLANRMFWVCMITPFIITFFIMKPLVTA